ncbi:MAG: hypothetical protein K2V38_18555, partial [Gemmataceae bacterium]|nr:hypothetical protein [Gemmataceae bacterium]
IAGVPSYYKAQARGKDGLPPRLVAEAIGRLAPFRAEVEHPDTVFIAARGEVRRYLHPHGPAVPDALYAVLADWRPGEPLSAALCRAKVDYLYVDEETVHVLANTGRARREIGFADGFAPCGWEKVGGDDAPGRAWGLYRRAGEPGPTPAPAALARFPRDLGYPDLRADGIDPDGWTRPACSAVLTRTPGHDLVVRGMVPLLPGDPPGFRTELAVFVGGVEVGRRELGVGDFEVRVPVSGGAGERAVECRLSAPRPLPAPDTRVVGARLTFLGFEPPR